MKLSTVALAAVALALSAQAARAEDYPSRPIHIIVPYTPGASTDLLARTWRCANDARVDNRASLGGATVRSARCRLPTLA